MKKISLCMIVRDEEENLAACLQSARPYVDEIIVCDTGSKDRSKDVARQFGALVVDFNPTTHPTEFFVDDEATCSQFDAPPPYSGMIALGNFAGARNESFRHATGDYVLWLDSDDVLEHGEKLRSIVDDMIARGIELGFVSYDYARDDKGRVHYRQWRERIIKRGSATWVNPIHEVMLPMRPNIPNAQYAGINVVHRRKADRVMVPNRNYKNLLRQRKTDLDAGRPLDPRTLFYLGQEARFIQPARAVEFYEDYLKASGWDEERSAAHLALGTLYEFGALPLPPDESYARANAHYGTAAAEMPNNPDGLFGMARIAYLRGRWHDCVKFTERSFAIGNTDSMLGANPTEREYRPHAYYNHALAKLGRYQEAIESCKRALATCPDDPGVPGGASGMLTNNLRCYEAFLAGEPPPVAASAEPPPNAITTDKNEPLHAPPQAFPRDALVIWAMQLWKQIQHVEANADKALRFLETLPTALKLDPVFARMETYSRNHQPVARQRVDVNKYALKSPTKPKAAGAKRLVLWIGPAVEDWSPDSPNTTGIGGSETAAIEVCKGFAKRGWEVVVYGCPPQPGIWDGVRYERHESYTGTGSDVDVFISSRDPGVMGLPNEAALKLLWVHDIHCGPQSAGMEVFLLRFDRVLCLSHWHKHFFCSQYPTLHPDRVIVTRNGIDLDRFADFNLRPRKNRLIWSSSPNRGLDLCLANFAFVRDAVPDAELHVYYGFDTWEKFANMRGDPNELRDIQRYKMLLESTPGVVWHGRVNQRELAEAFLASKVWPYITTFTETSCISAMEAQAAGAIPVTSRLAALPETVGVGKLIEPGPQYGQEFVSEVVRLLRDESYWCRQATEANAYARDHFSWSTLVDDWSRMFDELRPLVQINPVPLWRRAQ